MPDESDIEIYAIKEVMFLLKDLFPHQQLRVLEYLLDRVLHDPRGPDAGRSFAGIGE